MGSEIDESLKEAKQQLNQMKQQEGVNVENPEGSIVRKAIQSIDEDMEDPDKISERIDEELSGIPEDFEEPERNPDKQEENEKAEDQPGFVSRALSRLGFGSKSQDWDEIDDIEEELNDMETSDTVETEEENPIDRKPDIESFEESSVDVPRPAGPEIEDEAEDDDGQHKPEPVQGTGTEDDFPDPENAPEPVEETSPVDAEAQEAEEDELESGSESGEDELENDSEQNPAEEDGESFEDQSPEEDEVVEKGLHEEDSRDGEWRETSVDERIQRLQEKLVSEESKELGRLSELEKRVERLELDTDEELEQRLKQLENKVEAIDTPQQIDDRLTELENILMQPENHLDNLIDQSLRQNLEEMEQRVKSIQADLGDRIEVVEAEIERNSRRQQQITEKLETLEDAIDEVESGNQELDDKLERLWEALDEEVADIEHRIHSNQEDVEELLSTVVELSELVKQGMNR